MESPVIKQAHCEWHKKTNEKKVYYILELKQYTKCYLFYQMRFSNSLDNKDGYAKHQNEAFHIRNDVLFFDFYSLYPIWYYYVKKSYNSNHNKEIIHNIFEKITYKLAHLILEALEYSINSESGYIFGTQKLKFFGSLKKERQSFKKKYKLNLCTHPSGVDMKIKKLAFSLPEIWEDSYGGELWANACELYLELKNNLDNFNLDNIILSIDKIFDLEHNTGHILDKGQQFRFLKTDSFESKNAVLDFRKEAGLNQLSKFASRKVRNICLTLGPQFGLI